MNYDEVVAAVFEPAPEGLVPAPTRSSSAARRLRDAIEPLAMHAIWSPVTNAALAELGYDFMTGYVGGRAAALGRPTPGAVVATFAVFEPSMLSGLSAAAAGIADRDVLVERRTEATSRSLETLLGDDPAVGEVADALTAALDGLSGAGRPLFSGLADQPWPRSAAGRLWRACDLAREYRGDAHVAVMLGAGLDAVEANVLTELWVGYPLGTYSASRGWSEERIATAAARLTDQGLIEDQGLSPRGLSRREALEEQTDRLDRVVEGLGADADRIIAQLEAWSHRCVDERLFPPDPRKRAAG